MQIPKITPIVIAIFIGTIALVAMSIYYYLRRNDTEPPTTTTYIYSVFPALVLGILAVFAYDRYVFGSKPELLQENFYA